MYSSTVVKHSFEVHFRLLYTSTTLHFKSRCCTLAYLCFLRPICRHHSTVSREVPPTAQLDWLQVKSDGNKRNGNTKVKDFEWYLSRVFEYILVSYIHVFDNKISICFTVNVYQLSFIISIDIGP